MLLHPPSRYVRVLAVAAGLLLLIGLGIAFYPRIRTWYDNRTGDNAKGQQVSQDEDQRISGPKLRESFSSAQAEGVDKMDSVMTADTTGAADQRALRVVMEESFKTTAYYVGVRQGTVRQSQYEALLNSHYGLLSGYAQALAASDVAKVASAKTTLEEWPTLVGNFIKEIGNKDAEQTVKDAALAYVSAYEKLLETRQNKKDDKAALENVRTTQAALSKAVGEAVLTD